MMSRSADFLQRRREFLGTGVLALTWGVQTAHGYPTEDTFAPLRMGLITDLHYADKKEAGTRYYRETLAKLEEASQEFARSNLDFVVELGDLVDAADSIETELGYLKTVNESFQKLSADRHYVLGNHCVDTLTKDEFLGAVEQEKSYYSFDRAGVHFVVLDSCFRNDGQPYGRKNFKWTDANLPAEELEWLKADLDKTDLPTVVFAHQRLDIEGPHAVKNNRRVREILEQSQRVVAVFQGHSHQNDLTTHEGIYYCTLRAMVEGTGPENSGYSVLELSLPGSLRLTGFRTQASHHWQRRT